MYWYHSITPSPIASNEADETWEISTEAARAMIRLESRENEITGEDYCYYICRVSIPMYHKNGKPKGTYSVHQKEFPSLEAAKRFGESFLED